MSSAVIFSCIILYSVVLFAITFFTSRKADNASYFIGNKSSPWYVVAYGMIGASLSGVTFMSVPGAVYTTQFSYLQVVLGYLVGYAIIALVLMPVYYRLNLTSIYTYLDHRFGSVSYRTGSLFFILSRTIGAAFRMYIVVNVLQTFVFEGWHVPFAVTVLTFIVLILLYTFKGGVKTIIWTDTLQTTFMLVAMLFTIVFIAQQLNLDFLSLIEKIHGADYSKIFVSDVKSPNFFIKNFLGGAAISVAMTGLDQEMMQKNLSCRNIREAQKNMFTFSMILVLVNTLFLILGAILIFYASEKGIEINPLHTDDLFPTVALHFLTPIAGLIFILGLISAAYPSADGALTALTTAFCFDFLGIHKNTRLTPERRLNIRYAVHIAFAIVLLITIVGFRLINNDAVIRNLFRVASYTYGPLLGLYSFGFFTTRKLMEPFVWMVCILSPVACYFLSEYSPTIFNGYRFGFELLIVNGLFTFLGLFLISKKNTVIADV
ncbi:MAG: sodium:solute symporter [Chitinophagales bacterium]|nr:sodium:solute symporter [Chitinophagales bacterium]